MLVLVSCSDTIDGRPAQPTSQSPRGDTTTGQVPGPGVPKVLTPVDVSRFKQNPCNALTSTQISDLLGPHARVKPDLKSPAGPSCGWLSLATIQVAVPNVDDLGLTSIYRSRGGIYPFFLPLAPVNGLPAVAYGQDDSRASRGECDVAVGVSDRETIEVSVRQSPENKGKEDPCESARKVAEKILGNLPGAR
ncbi:MULTISPECIES: DUF3558 domain-containing protein [Amycolatopsis]|uniref:DUF3558 domain-containing protein n=1 Tax=Amycolatopsis TaxID=1813 RepID=UPI00196B5B08|nr:MULTISPECIES: DUF3558 domain-containing protein [Amycolatopsis]